MKANDNFLLRKIYGKNILMPIRANTASEDPVLLNEVATYIWESAVEGSSFSDLMNKMSKVYGLVEGTPEWIAVKQFVGQMMEMGLIEEV